jgi:hypothetical protein
MNIQLKMIGKEAISSMTSISLNSILIGRENLYVGNSSPIYFPYENTEGNFVDNLAKLRIEHAQKLAKLEEAILKNNDAGEINAALIDQGYIYYGRKELPYMKIMNRKVRK